MLPSVSDSAGRVRARRLAGLNMLPVIVLALVLLPGQPALAEPSAELQYSLAAEASTQRDYAGMLVLLRQSAASGYVPAQELLGVALLNGPVLYGAAVPRDFCGAFKWFSRAAEQGSAVGRLHASVLHRARRDRVRTCP